MGAPCIEGSLAPAQLHRIVKAARRVCRSDSSWPSPSRQVACACLDAFALLHALLGDASLASPTRVPLASRSDLTNAQSDHEHEHDDEHAATAAPGNDPAAFPVRSLATVHPCTHAPSEMTAATTRTALFSFSACLGLQVWLAAAKAFCRSPTPNPTPSKIRSALIPRPPGSVVLLMHREARGVPLCA
jgi:hypothetical protein